MTSTGRPAVSVIVPTYNPRLDLLNWTLEGLAQQTFDGLAPGQGAAGDMRFEVVIVDNNSTPRLERDLLRWDSGCATLQIVREPRQGLVYARIAGLEAAGADLIVFVDDDNRLDAGYLAEAVRISREEPSIGCFGGIARPVLEKEMAAWKRPLLAYLGVRDYGAAPITSTRNHWGEWEPIGAGMVCRRSVVEEFARWVREAPPASRLDRKGRGWMSGSDTLLAISAYKLGYACSYQPLLQLSHWIKAERLALVTSARILFGHGRSQVILERLKGRDVERLGAAEALKALDEWRQARVERSGFRAGSLECFLELGRYWEARRAPAGEDAEWRAGWLRETQARQKATDRAVAHWTQVAGERLRALETADAALKTLGAEADRRASALRDAARALEHRERRIQELEAVTAERLEALDRSAAALQEASEESRRRARDLETFAGIVQARDARIAALEIAAREKAAELQQVQAELKAVAAEAEIRERALQNGALILEARDRRIGELEQMARERLEALEAADAVLRQVAADAEEQRRIQAVRAPATDLPRISIVVPNYNSGPLLERALRSLTAQNYGNLQVILADAASDDVSRETIERYRGLFDPLLSRKDKGPADGLNHGFHCATGEIYGWLCSDDELLPGALHHVAELFLHSPQTDIVVGGCRRVYADGSGAILHPPPDFWSILGMKNSIEQPSVFWRGSLHDIVGDLDTSYDLAFDWDFWCRMKKARARVLTTNRLLSCYHFSENNKTSRGGRKHVDEQFRIIREYGPLGAALPMLYRFLYLHFDLKGVFDSPPGCSRARVWLFGVTWSALELLFGKRLMSLYNWRFASCQERRLKWW